MARPNSMPDLSQVLSSSPPALALQNDRPKKKPSISLAAGLIMNAESPKFLHDAPRRGWRSKDGQWSENLFYAYAHKPNSSLNRPYILTFANAAIAERWWTLVRQEYPRSTREGAQLFILRGDDVQGQIQDNPLFHDLDNKWFCTDPESFTGAIPLQDIHGNLLSSTIPSHIVQRKDSVQSPVEAETDAPLKLGSLSETLEKMNTMISENSNQIRALSAAQSEGLQRMQAINESNSTQIKALADSQVSLQAIINHNAANYIALSNSQFQSQESVKGVLQQNAEHIKELADGQAKLSSTCAEMMRSISSLSTCFPVRSPSDTATTAFSPLGNRISPPPRKLNRRIKSVWYEYDATPLSPSKTAVDLETPPRTPPGKSLTREPQCLNKY